MNAHVCPSSLHKEKCFSGKHQPHDSEPQYLLHTVGLYEFDCAVATDVVTTHKIY